ncbi:hypothetical protein R9X47_28410 [Wukongibacter baidiensis]|uniref:hypothetical protein n=1 Tax=Wukongibacter baidiensis TaxID=1723361 RepID=UPI003D7FEA19
MAEKTTLLLKDQLFNEETVGIVADCIVNAYPDLDKRSFTDDIVRGFPNRELKERMSWMREIIEKYLPDNYETTIAILLNSLKNVTAAGDFTFSSYTDYVMANGCKREHLELSLNTIGEFTKFFSGEFAIRRFINEFPEETYEKMEEWSLSDNVDQRRLASEGLRPKLPWAIGINFDYKKGAQVLDNLYYDNERYVTRSVANHLNDLSKIDPDYVVEILDKWQKSKKQTDKEMSYIIGHALRTSIKRGHINTLEFLGYNREPEIEVKQLKILKKDLKLGEYLEFSFDIIAMKKESLIIDYKITYPMANNKTSEKVFKIKKAVIKKGDPLTVEKRHLFKKMTTKKLYSGDYKIEIQINGKIYEGGRFNLKV